MWLFYLFFKPILTGILTLTTFNYPIQNLKVEINVLTEIKDKNKFTANTCKAVKVIMFMQNKN